MGRTVRQFRYAVAACQTFADPFTHRQARYTLYSSDATFEPLRASADCSNGSIDLSEVSVMTYRNVFEQPHIKHLAAAAHTPLDPSSCLFLYPKQLQANQAFSPLEVTLIPTVSLPPSAVPIPNFAHCRRLPQAPRFPESKQPSPASVDRRRPV
jgi:hypothetical protein